MAGIAIVLFAAKRSLRRLFGSRGASERQAAVRIAPVVITLLLAMQGLAVLIAFNADNVGLREAAVFATASTLLTIGYILYTSRRG